MESNTMVLLIFLVLNSLYISSSGDMLTEFAEAAFVRMSQVTRVLPFPMKAYLDNRDAVGSFYIPVNSESDICIKHSNYTYHSLINREFWAFKIIDASSKVSSGMLEGYFLDMGSFDQCLNLKVPGDLFMGKYCAVEIKGIMPDVVRRVLAKETIIPQIFSAYIFAACVPSTCSINDLMTHFNFTFAKFNASSYVMEESCTTIDKSGPLSTEDSIATYITIFLFSMVFVGTLEDKKVNAEKNKYLTAFSIKTNFRRLFDTRVDQSMITTLNGLRVLAFCWVAAGHRLMFKFLHPNVRLVSLTEIFPNILWSPLVNGGLAIEIFFFLSGLLVTYKNLKNRQKGVKTPIYKFYLTRYLRLTPCFLFIVVVANTIGLSMTDGPLWRRITGISRTLCMHKWWNIVLYIYNYTHPRDICLAVVWYLAVNFQLFLFSPVLLIPLHKKPKLGLFLTAVALAFTSMAGIWNAYSLGLRAGGIASIDGRTTKTFFGDVIVTHVRASTFLIGMAVGYLILKIKEGQITLKMSKAHLWAGWLLSIFMILFPVLFITHFHQPDYVYNPWLEVLYQVFHRQIFILGISLVVLACVLGHGGIVNKMLSWTPFVPLSRLSYSAYLVHVMVQIIITFNRRTPEYLTVVSLLHQSFGDISLSYVCAVILYLILECPCANLIKIVFPDVEEPKETPDLQLQSYTSTIELPVLKEDLPK